MLQVELRARKFIIIIIHHLLLLLLDCYHLLFWQLADCFGVAFGLNLGMMRRHEKAIVHARHHGHIRCPSTHIYRAAGLAYRASVPRLTAPTAIAGAEDVRAEAERGGCSNIANADDWRGLTGHQAGLLVAAEATRN